jgi:ArsR family transcriptional regulator, arsenate/arsenite/antimonite-responsive transcriptional repressor
MATTERALSAAPAARTKGCCVPLAPLLPGSTAEELAAVHRALADPTRVQMLHLLKASSQPICVCDFTAAFDLGQPTVSHHLGKLRAAGFVSSHREGIWAFYRLAEDMPDAARAALAIIP